MNLEQSILEDLSNEFNKEINGHVSKWFQMYHAVEQGWTKVELSRLQDNRHAVDITMWLHDQKLREGQDYYRDGREFAFKSAETATMFLLRWI